MISTALVEGSRRVSPRDPRDCWPASTNRLCGFGSWARFVDSVWSAGFVAAQQSIADHERFPFLTGRDAGSVSMVPRVTFARRFAARRSGVLTGNGSDLVPRLAAIEIAVPKDGAFFDLFVARTASRWIVAVRQNCRCVGELAVALLVGWPAQHVLGLAQFTPSTFVEGAQFNGTSPPLRGRVKHVRTPAACARLALE